jgi:hypothetical protein
MKKIILASIFLVLNSLCFSQLKIDSFYENRNDYLVFSVIKQFDTISKSKLLLEVKNWSGRYFVNAEQVVVSETSEQLVFNYVTQIKTIALGIASYSPWGIRLIVQIKDNKIRIQFYDNANAYWPTSSGGIRAGLHKLDYCFGKNGVSKKIWTEGLVEMKEKMAETANILEQSIKKSELKSQVEEW